ncbi:MAG: hypothetical protein PVI71_06370 [Desulfobacterales bacterium]|jgi:hypothetical protein
MKNKLTFGLALLLLFAPGMTRAEAPHQVGGFILGRNIEDYKDRVIMDTALPVRYAEYTEEVEIKFTEGFKSGLIAYGTCARPGHIVRLKLKYADSSKDFYEDLLKRFKKRFGEPDEYRGDPFHILVAWKWSFVDKQDHRISLTLQHNSMDPEGKMGNAVKITDLTLIEKDALCYKRKQLNQREKLRQQKWKAVNPELSGWDLFVPR